MNSIPYGKHSILKEDIEAVKDVLESDFLTQGPKISEFERAFSEYIGSKYAIAVSNGTAALHLSALALDVQSGDRWITSPITFAASANCILYCGGIVDFVDIDPDTGLLDLKKLSKALTSRPKGTYKGIIPIDFAGAAVNLQELNEIIEGYDLKIIEDACHAPGGYFKDRDGVRQNCGNTKFSDLSIFSFHPVKHIACGEGGMITTNNFDLYEKLLRLRTHGITKDNNYLEENHEGWYYEMQELGYNYRLTDIQAALGLSQLKRADVGLKRRKEIAARYDFAFDPLNSITILSRNNRDGHAFHLYVIKTEKRKALYNFLKQNNINAQVHYIPVYSLPYFRINGHKDTKLRGAEDYYNKCLSIPMYPSMLDEEVDYVIDKIIEFVV